MSLVAAPGIQLAGGLSATRRRGIGVLLLALAAIMVLIFGLGAQPGVHATFQLSSGTSIHVANLAVPVRATSFVLAAVCAALGAAQLLGERHTYLMLGVGLGLFVFDFLTYTARGESLDLVQLLQSTVVAAVPLTLGALSGVLCERSGVINVAIEGQFLVAAFAAAMVDSATHNLWLGLLAGVALGVLLALVLAVFALKYLVDQVIVGIVLDVFALGLTSFLNDQILVPQQQTFNSPTVFPAVAIPGLSKIPLVGPALFDQNIFVYLMFASLIVIQFGLFRTRWGLRVRAVGEHPEAAETVGISVLRTRYRNVLLGGVMAGIGGAYFTIGSVGQFSKDMTDGQGFIALAAMIFGRWNPFGAFTAALLFGFTNALQDFLAVLNSPIPSFFLIMAPYVVTVIAVAGLVGRVRAPAADGKPYERH